MCRILVVKMAFEIGEDSEAVNILRMNTKSIMRCEDEVFVFVECGSQALFLGPVFRYDEFG